MLLTLLTLLTLLIFMFLIFLNFKSKFGTIKEIKNNHQKNNCYYMNRQYPVGNVPGSNIILTPAENVELDRKFEN